MRTHAILSLGRVLPLVKVEVAEPLGRLLRERHLVVVVDDPLAVAQDVTHVVAHVHGAPHVRDERPQLVLGLAVAQLVRGAAAGGRGRRRRRCWGGSCSCSGILAPVVVGVAESSGGKSV